MAPSDNWWARGQRYTAPDGTVIVRVGSGLYLESGNTHYELLILQDKTDYRAGFTTGRMHFDVSCPGALRWRKGTLTCTPDSATLQWEGESAQNCALSPIPTRPAAHRKMLADFDNRQVPALLVQLGDTGTLFYFSQSIHKVSRPSGQPTGVDRGFTLVLNEHPRELYGLQARTLQGRLWVRYRGGPSLKLPMPNQHGNGMREDGTVLHQLSLGAYDIRHNRLTGALIAIRKKR